MLVKTLKNMGGQILGYNRFRPDLINSIWSMRSDSLLFAMVRRIKKRMIKAFNKKVRRQVYQVGDLVIKRIIFPQSDPRGKWTPTYEGPFMIRYDPSRDRGLHEWYDSQISNWRRTPRPPAKLFERLKKYKLRLNPNKCTFGVRSDKLLTSLSAVKVSKWTLQR